MGVKIDCFSRICWCRAIVFKIANCNYLFHLCERTTVPASYQFLSFSTLWLGLVLLAVYIVPLPSPAQSRLPLSFHLLSFALLLHPIYLPTKHTFPLAQQATAALSEELVYSDFVVEVFMDQMHLRFVRWTRCWNSWGKGHGQGHHCGLLRPINVASFARHSGFCASVECLPLWFPKEPRLRITSVLRITTLSEAQVSWFLEL